MLVLFSVVHCSNPDFKFQVSRIGVNQFSVINHEDLSHLDLTFLRSNQAIDYSVMLSEKPIKWLKNTKSLQARFPRPSQRSLSSVG